MYTRIQGVVHESRISELFRSCLWHFGKLDKQLRVLLSYLGLAGPNHSPDSNSTENSKSYPISSILKIIQM